MISATKLVVISSAAIYFKSNINSVIDSDIDSKIDSSV